MFSTSLDLENENESRKYIREMGLLRENDTTNI